MWPYQEVVPSSNLPASNQRRKLGTFQQESVSISYYLQLGSPPWCLNEVFFFLFFFPSNECHVIAVPVTYMWTQATLEVSHLKITKGTVWKILWYHLHRLYTLSYSCASSLNISVRSVRGYPSLAYPESLMFSSNRLTSLCVLNCTKRFPSFCLRKPVSQVHIKSLWLNDYWCLQYHPVFPLLLWQKLLVFHLHPFFPSFE